MIALARLLEDRGGKDMRVQSNYSRSNRVRSINKRFNPKIVVNLSSKADLAEGNVNVIVLPLKRCLDSWETCQGCSKALRVQRIKMVK